MSTKIFIFLCVIFSPALAVEANVSRCPEYNDIVDLNLTRFSGDWNVIGGIPPREKFGECLKFKIQAIEPNRLKMDFFSFNTTLRKTTQWKVQVDRNGDRNISGSWEIKNTAVKIENLRHQIVEIDEEDYQYAVMILCGVDPKTGTDLFHGIILSRDRSLPNKIVGGVPLRKYLDNSITKFLTKGKIQDADYSEAVCAEIGL